MIDMIIGWVVAGALVIGAIIALAHLNVARMRKVILKMSPEERREYIKYLEARYGFRSDD